MNIKDISFKQNGGTCKDLNALSSPSRAVWLGTPGYSEKYLEESRPLIDMDESYLQKNWVWVGFTSIDGKPVPFGFFSLKIRDSDQEQILDHFWIDTSFMRQGLGKILFKKVIEVCSSLGWDRFLIYSDPPAEGFYLKMGAIRIGQVRSRLEGGPAFPELEYRISKEFL